MSIIKRVTLQKIVACDFWYDPRMMRGLRFLHWCFWRFKSSGFWLYVVGCVVFGILKDHGAFIFTFKQSKNSHGYSWTAWRWRLTELHTFQKMYVMKAVLSEKWSMPWYGGHVGCVNTYITSVLTRMDLKFCLQPQDFDGEAELQVCRLWNEGGSRICQQISLLWISWPILLYWLPYKSAGTHTREGSYQVGLHTVSACYDVVYGVCFIVIFVSALFFRWGVRTHFFVVSLMTLCTIFCFYIVILG